jgi:hypothetical protein
VPPHGRRDWWTLIEGAAAGSGEEASRLDAKARDAWRKTALEWLNVVLDLHRAAIAAKDPTAIETLRRARFDPDLIGVREPSALSALPSSERAAWWALWSEIELTTGAWKPTKDAR